MKYFLVILYFVFIIEVDGKQAIRINEFFNNIPLKEALTTLNAKYDLKIAYGDNAVSEYTVHALVDNLSVFDTFKKILEPTSLTFELLEEDVIIIKKKPKRENTDEVAYSLIGVVQDAFSGERLPHAYVWVQSENKNLLTNTDGYFSITLASLPANLMISYLGYRDTTLLIDDQDINKRLQINLAANPLELNEIVITGNTTNDFEINDTAGKIDFNPKVAYSTPSTGEIDVIRTIQLLPGINATNEISSGLSIEGGNTNQNLFLFDGFTVYHMDHFFGYYSAINPVAIKSLQLYKGGYDARYGGRVSGVVDMTGKAGNLNKISGSLGINLLSINTSLEIPLKKNISSLFFSARRSYTDIYSTNLFKKIFENYSSDFSSENQASSVGSSMGHHGNMQNTPQITSQSDIKPEFYYNDLNLKLSSKIGLKNHISFSFYDSNDVLHFKESSVSNIVDTLSIAKNTIGNVNWGNIGSSFKWSRLWNASHYSNALISYSRYRSNFGESSTTTSTNLNQESFTDATTFEQDNSIEDITIKLDHEWFLPNEQLIRLGMQSSILGTIYSSKTDNITFVKRDELNKGLFSLYGLSVLQPVHGLTLNLGLRGSYYSSTQKWYPEPRIALVQQLSSNTRLKVAYGIYHQFINQSYTKNALQGSRDFWLLADNDIIPVQRANHFSAGLDYHIGDLLFAVDFFKKDFDGLLEYAFSNGGLVTEFDNYENMFFQGSGKSEGMEFLLKKSGKTFNAWLGYTYGTVKYVFDALNSGTSYYADQDQRHEINTYASYQLGKFEFFGTWIYGSGRPYSQSNGPMINQNSMNEFDSHVTVVDIGEKNNLRFPPYHRLDIGGKYTCVFTDFNAVFALSIFNLYNRQNIINYSYNQIMGSHSTGHGMSTPIVETNAVTSMGITPNISITINF